MTSPLHLACELGILGFGQEWLRFGQKWDKSWTFFISEISSEESPGFVIFEASLNHFGPKPETHELNDYQLPGCSQHQWLDSFPTIHHYPHLTLRKIATWMSKNAKKLTFFFQKIVNGNFFEKKWKFLVIFFWKKRKYLAKNIKFLAIFSQSNGNFPEGEVGIMSAEECMCWV